MSIRSRLGWLTPALVCAFLLSACVGVCASTLSGSVTKNSSALPNAYIDVIDSGGSFQEVQTASDGSYSVTGLAAGNADVYCYSPENLTIGHQVKDAYYDDVSFGLTE